MHVNLIKSSNLEHEREFLFAPYSVFTVAHAHTHDTGLRHRGLQWSDRARISGRGWTGNIELESCSDRGSGDGRWYRRSGPTALTTRRRTG